ncbi:hypothetical protein BJ165DRAFT_1305048, partial [Panaeolus papilionaceus]
FDNKDKFEGTKCHPGTREILLERLTSWLSAPSNSGRLITWVEGPMGSGKTAIAMTVVEWASANKKLICAFIFRRSQPGRDTEKRFITTLAYQLGIFIPLVRPFIEAEIYNDPSVLERSLTDQLERLILHPLREM